MSGRKIERTISVQLYHSPCGDLLLGALGDRLCLCDWTTASHRESVDRRLLCGLQADYKACASTVIREAGKQLDEYFNGERTAFDVPLLLVGTDFQKQVWNGLLKIPYGTTRSYAGCAGALGRPKSVRAVANANGANAISIFIPCHRIIGSDGALTGYAGGMEAKRYLLDLERNLFQPGGTLP